MHRLCLEPPSAATNEQKFIIFNVFSMHIIAKMDRYSSFSMYFQYISNAFSMQQKWAGIHHFQYIFKAFPMHIAAKMNRNSSFAMYVQCILQQKWAGIHHFQSIFNAFPMHIPAKMGRNSSFSMYFQSIFNAYCSKNG